VSDGLTDDVTQAGFKMARSLDPIESIILPGWREGIISCHPQNNVQAAALCSFCISEGRRKVSPTKSFNKQQPLCSKTKFRLPVAKKTEPEQPPT
jgi:hypothetical protein